MRNIPLYLVGLCFILAGIVFADGPCKSDIEKLCKDVQPGEGRVMKCLNDHEAELSAECQARRKNAKEQFKGAKQACHDDVEQFCADAGKGRGRIVKCLKENKDKLSESCKAQFNK